jgi:hypothetical protein
MPDLSEYIARKLMEVGDDPGFKCTRIQFMAFQEGKPERDCGGLCESSLVAVIRSILDQYVIQKEATDAE